MKPGKKKRLVIAQAVSEMVPFAKTGGLADVAGALPLVLSELGHDCHSFLPCYRMVKQKWLAKAKPAGEVFVPLAGRREKSVIWRFKERAQHTVYFVENDRYFNREHLYGTPDGDYPDNGGRFAFFSRAVLEALRVLGISPQILHVHDWQASLIPIYLKERYGLESRFNGLRSVLTIHNMAYQGLFEKDILPLIDLPQSLFQMQKMEFWGKVNYLKGGLVYADLINTVSSTYAEEIQTAEFGCGLDGLLQSRSESLFGVLNGIDTDEWNPETDKYLAAKFSIKSLDGKAFNKIELQKSSGLEVNQDLMLIGMVGRLADQKGFDLVFKALGDLLKLPIQLVILGTGDRIYQEQLGQLHSEHSSKISVELGFDNELAHRIYASADVFLMPSRFEPCGLGQLISFRYGTIPIVRRTGGLADTVRDVEESPSDGNGFVFTEYSYSALLDAVERAWRVFQDKSSWLDLVRRVMQLDFSWKRSAEAYVELYQKLMEHNNDRLESRSEKPVTRNQ